MAQSISNLAIGAKVKFGNYKVETEALAPLIWKVADKNHSGYPANSVTLITERIIDFRGFDAMEPTNTDADRKTKGNNRYLHANMRQWLNDSGASWWAASHAYDATPNDAGMNTVTGYDDKPGFKDYFTADELGALLDTTLTVAKNTVTDGGGLETVVDKFFLASTTEVGLANENSIVEGSLLSLFSNDASRIAYATQAAITNSLSTSKPANTSTGWHWWLRTPDSTGSYNVRNVNTTGTRSGSTAYGGYVGIRPLCNLKSDSLVTETTDNDGCYVMVWTTPHAITLDKAITLNPGDALTKLKFAPKVNDSAMTLKEVDAEKLIYEKKDVGSESVTLKIDGTDAKIDKIAYTVS